MFEQFLNLQFVVLNHLPASPGEVVGHHRRLNPCGHSQTTRRRHHPYLLLVSSLAFNLNLNQMPVAVRPGQHNWVIDLPE